MKRPNRFPKKLVIVHWRDAHSSVTGRPKGDYPMFTVGWLIKRGKTWTLIANERPPRHKSESKWRGYTRIPSRNVVDIQRLAVRRKAQKGAST